MDAFEEKEEHDEMFEKFICEMFEKSFGDNFEEYLRRPTDRVTQTTS